MPTRPRSPSRAIHSWSFVYFKPAGYVIDAPMLRALRPLVERRRHDARPRAAAANVHVDFRAWRGAFDRHIREADRLLQKRRLSAARHLSAPGAVHIDIVPVARN